jgi:hypothetical protein
MEGSELNGRNRTTAERITRPSIENYCYINDFYITRWIYVHISLDVVLYYGPLQLQFILNSFLCDNICIP